MRHSLFVYDDDNRMVEKMVPFLCLGLAEGERAVVVLDRRKWDRLAGALGPEADNRQSPRRLPTAATRTRRRRRALGGPPAHQATRAGALAAGGERAAVGLVS